MTELQAGALYKIVVEDQSQCLRPKFVLRFNEYFILNRRGESRTVGSN